MVCKQCNAAFTESGDLKQHKMRKHAKEKPFVCNTCSAAFSCPGDLRKHVRIHTGQKPYSCTMCNKSFADRSNLRAHMQTHSPSKNFQCTRCNKTFALKSYLNKHYESACFKDQPIPAIDTPPVTPAPSELSDGLASPGSSSTMSDHLAIPQQFSPASSTSSSSPPSISSLLSVLPSHPVAQSTPLQHHPQQLVRV